MKWIIDNIEWLFGVVVVPSLGYVVKMIFKKKEVLSKDVIKQTQNNNQQQTVNINIEPQSKQSGPIIKNQADIKATIHILFIDDEKFDHVGVLKNAGWINTKSIKDVKRIDCVDILRANVIFVDINGVGCTLFPKEQGLGVAAKIKELYPTKYVVVYSAKPQQLHSSLSLIDAVLPKNADPYEYINILENLTN